MIPAEEIERRLAAPAQAPSPEAGWTAPSIVQHTDLAYLTGTNQQAHLIVPADGEPRLLVRRVLERARAESPLERIEPLGSLSGLPGGAARGRAGAGRRDRPRARRAAGRALPRATQARLEG